MLVDDLDVYPPAGSTRRPPPRGGYMIRTTPSLLPRHVLSSIDLPQLNMILDPAHAEPLHALYNLDDDPSERHNVSDDHPDIVHSLHAKLERCATTPTAHRPAAVPAAAGPPRAPPRRAARSLRRVVSPRLWGSPPPRALGRPDGTLVRSSAFGRLIRVDARGASFLRRALLCA